LRGGTRGVHYGPTLGNQLAVVDQLNAHPDSPVVVPVSHYWQFPHALNVLRLLRPPATGVQSWSSSRLQIAYAADDPNDGHLTVRELSSSGGR
jgi:hypothetical protein